MWDLAALVVDVIAVNVFVFGITLVFVKSHLKGFRIKYASDICEALLCHTISLWVVKREALNKLVIGFNANWKERFDVRVWIYVYCILRSLFFLFSLGITK